MKLFFKIFLVIFAILIIGGATLMLLKKISDGKEKEPLLKESFVPKELDTASLYVEGLIPHKTFGLRNAGTGGYAAVFPAEYGKTYEMHFPTETEALIAVVTDSDPRALSLGQSMPYTEIRAAESTPKKEDLAGLLYTPQKSNEYFVLYTGEKKNTDVRITEHAILAAEDTAGPWYQPTGVGDFYGNEGSFASYRWTSDEVFEHLYEPLREKYPSYIKREHIGKDASDTYDMYCYIFEPKNYEQTVFLSAGIHANEEEGYLSLAYFLGEVANADKNANAGLRYLRESVRLIVIPIVNVWGVNQTHSLEKANWSIRYNANEADLNRDFGEKTQQETKNVCAVLEKYGKDISFGIDFHTTPNDNGSDLFFNFNIGTENASINFQTTNHIYHRMKTEGMITAQRPHLVPSSSAYGNLAAIDGKYMTATTVQSYLWNEYGIPPLTVEYMNFTSGTSPKKGSAEGLSMAVEICGNFIIQNALFYAK